MRNKQKKIPVPLSEWKRIARQRLAPPIVFVILLAVITHLWRGFVMPVEMIGEVEAPRAEVIAPQAGKIAQMYVRPYMRVQSGEPLVVLMTTDPAILESHLAVIRAEVELLLLTLDPLVGRRRADLDYERLRLEWMNQRVERATAEAHRIRAHNQLQRMTRLYRDELVAISEVEEAKAERDALIAEIEGRDRIVASLEEQLEQLRIPTRDDGDPLLTAIQVHEQRLRLVEAELGPVTLYAPTDGVVSMFNRGAGEHVVAGESIMSVMAESSDRVVAYMRQPIRVRPEIGMPVRVQARTRDGGVGIGEVLHVSAQLEMLPELMLPPGMRPEKALLLLVSLPETMNVMPGERVDLTLSP